MEETEADMQKEEVQEQNGEEEQKIQGSGDVIIIARNSKHEDESPFGNDQDY